MLQPEQIAANIQALRTRIATAAQGVGRAAGAVTLIAVTKTHPSEALLAAVAAGVVDIGENRVQEAAEKYEALGQQGAAIRWHLIGHLQRNKARQAVRIFDLIHSLDSLRLAEALNRHAAELRPGSPLPVLLQVNVSGEPSKEGFELAGGPDNPALAAFYAEVGQIVALPNLQLQGLMTIAPLLPNPEEARPVFRDLRRLRDSLAAQFPQLQLSQLSMGMSDDAEIAVQEGATMVRLGRAIFGSR